MLLQRSLRFIIYQLKIFNLFLTYKVKRFEHWNSRNLLYKYKGLVLMKSYSEFLFIQTAYHQCNWWYLICCVNKISTYHINYVYFTLFHWILITKSPLVVFFAIFYSLLLKFTYFISQIVDSYKERKHILLFAYFLFHGMK